MADMARAKTFYKGMICETMHQENAGGVPMAYSPTGMGTGKVGGALAHSPYHTPNVDGAKIYLNGNPGLAHMLAKVESLGSKIVSPKMPVGEYGHMVIFADTEGNVVALHSNN